MSEQPDSTHSLGSSTLSTLRLVMGQIGPTRAPFLTKFEKLVKITSNTEEKLRSDNY